MVESKGGTFQSSIREFHLFAGIGGGIYGGKLLGHECVGAVEIMPYARGVLAQRIKDGWMDGGMDIESNTDVTKMDGKSIKGKFDVLCGGFPCQAFSTAAHGKNIPEKNLWDHMFRISRESAAPIVFGENVVLRAIDKAKSDLESIGYKVQRIRLGCEDLGADHRRNRFWLMAVKNDKSGREAFARLSSSLSKLPVMVANYWANPIDGCGEKVDVIGGNRRDQLLGVGNAQSPLVAAVAFRVLANRHIDNADGTSEIVDGCELSRVFEKRKTWIDGTFRESGKIKGLVHTPTTMANYACPSMMKHEGCRNFKEVFGRPNPDNAEYLMGFPIGASNPCALKRNNLEKWLGLWSES